LNLREEFGDKHREGRARPKTKRLQQESKMAAARKQELCSKSKGSLKKTKSLKHRI
jgi:hypothetical protein